MDVIKIFRDEIEKMAVLAKPGISRRAEGGVPTTVPKRPSGVAASRQPDKPAQPVPSTQSTPPDKVNQPADQSAQQAPAKEYFPTFKAIGRGVKGVGKGLAIGTGLGGMYAVSEGIKGLREGEQQNR